MLLLRGGATAASPTSYDVALCFALGHLLPSGSHRQPPLSATAAAATAHSSHHLRRHRFPCPSSCRHLKTTTTLAPRIVCAIPIVISAVSSLSPVSLSRCCTVLPAVPIPIFSVESAFEHLETRKIFWPRRGDGHRGISWQANKRYLPKNTSVHSTLWEPDPVHAPLARPPRPRAGLWRAAVLA